MLRCKGFAETVTIPKELLKDLYMGLAKVEEVLATLEELLDKEGLERIHKAEEEYEKGEYATVQSSNENSSTNYKPKQLLTKIQKVFPR